MPDQNPYSAPQGKLEGGHEAQRGWNAGGLNSRLCYLHAGFVLIYVVAAGMIYVAARDTVRAVAGCALCSLIAFLHAAAAYGNSRGARYGRLMSRILGCLTLLAFPVGTIIGALMLWDTESKWQAGGEEISH